MDFINALESDKLIFVEGEDDAKVFRILLNQQLNNPQKYMFWVLGGISEVFENIMAYKAVFSSLKNGNSLWDKSVLVFDKDELSVEHKNLFVQKFKEKLGIETFSTNAYTFEATLFTDLSKTASLLSQLVQQATGTAADAKAILNELQENYLNFETFLRAKFNDDYFKNAFYRFRNSKANKANEIFSEQVIRMDDYTFPHFLPKYFNEVLHQKEFYKLMDKYDVESVIKQTIDKYGLNFSIESDFIEIIKLVDKSTWINEWDFLNKIK